MIDSPALWYLSAFENGVYMGILYTVLGLVPYTLPNVHLGVIMI